MKKKKYTEDEIAEISLQNRLKIQKESYLRQINLAKDAGKEFTDLLVRDDYLFQISEYWNRFEHLPHQLHYGTKWTNVRFYLT